jgi:hypothetical protein
MSKHWHARERQQAFVATTHAARFAASKKDADGSVIQTHSLGV